MRKQGIRIIAVLCLILAGGCTTTGSGYLVTVSNSSDSPVTDVAIEIGGLMKYSAPKIEPHADSDYKQLRDGISTSPRMSWKNKDGAVVSREVKLAKSLPASFRGRVLFQIDRGSEVRMFVMPEDESQESSIPWGNSGEWDGTVYIPGMTE